jgi:non-ribosomal peptide synthetase component F
LALRNYPAGEKKFADFLSEVKERTLKAFENQEYQYEDLVEQVVKKRDPSRNPLFDTMFDLQNTVSRKIEFPGLKLGSYEFENKIAIFDLSLTVAELEENLAIGFEYNTRLFKPDTIERFMDFYRQIISIIVNNREIKIEEILINHHYTEIGTNIFSTDLGDFESMFPGA